MTVAAVVSLWSIDLLVNLGFVERFPGAGLPYSRPLDFIGLFLAGLPLSIGALLVALIGAPVLVRLLGRADSRREGVALLSALLSGMAVFRQAAWLPTRSVILMAVIVSGLVVLTVYLALRGRRDDSDPVRTATLCRHLLLVPLLAGFAAAAGGRLLQGDFLGAVLSGVQAVAVAALFIACLMDRRLLGSGGLAWLPAAVAVALAVLSCLNSSRYGEDDAPTRLPAAHDRPDIVFIVLDTVRADHLQRFGYVRNTMPALESWAIDAHSFPRAVSPAGWTSPAHASFFSGLTVSQHGVHYASGRGTGAQFKTPAIDGISWLPALLEEEGYYRLAVTANDLAIPEEISGFSRILAPSRSAWSRPSLASLADRVIPWTVRLSECTGWRMPYVDAGEIVDIAMRALPAEPAPVFLFLNMLDAHAPYNPPNEALDLLDLEPGHLFSRYERHRQITLDWDSLPDGRIRYLTDLYDGELRWVDLHLERFLRWVDQRLGPNTVVVITSDHGEELGEEGRVGHEYGLSQRLLHVPLFVKGPGVPAGESAGPVSLRNLFPFMVGIGSGAGADLQTLLANDGPGVLAERYPSGHNRRVLGEAYARAWVALIEGGLKAVGPSSAGSSVYDVESSGFDGEVPATGVAAGDDLSARIDAYWESSRDRRTLHEGDLSESESRRLRSLGYVE